LNKISYALPMSLHAMGKLLLMLDAIALVQAVADDEGQHGGNQPGQHREQPEGSRGV
jgi:hypothetical protein